MNKTTSAKPINMLIQWVSRPPLALPVIGGAHVLAFIYTFVTAAALGSVGWGYWLQPIWMFLYTFFWFVACTLRKWGVFGYVFLTVVNTLIYLFTSNVYTRDLYSSNLFLIDLLFCLPLLFYIKRFK
jgi:hypothetical protein